MSGGTGVPAAVAASDGPGGSLRLTSGDAGAAAGRIELTLGATGELRVERSAPGRRTLRTGRIDRALLARVLTALAQAAPGTATADAAADAPGRRLTVTGLLPGGDSAWDDASGTPVPGIGHALGILAAQALEPAAAGRLPAAVVRVDQPAPESAGSAGSADTGDTDAGPRPAAAVGTVAGRPAYALARPGEGFGLAALEDAAPLGGSDTDSGVLPTAVALGTVEDRELFAVGGEDGAVQVWDAVSGELLHGTAGGEGAQVVSAGFVQGVPLAFSAGREGEVRAWHTEDGRALGLLPVGGHGAGALCQARCADLDLLAAGGDDGLVRVWDAATGEQLHLLVGHTDRITALAVLSLGNQALLASAGQDGTVRLWDLATGGPVAVLTGHSGSVTGLAFVPGDGDPRLASCALDGTVRLWDVYTGAAVHGWPAGQGWLTALAAVRVGGRPVLVTGDENGTTVLWDAASGTRIGDCTPPGASRSTAWPPPSGTAARGSPSATATAPSGSGTRPTAPGPGPAPPTAGR
ncbi:hypothetical protein GCM10025734_15460 [Kitasatospora paranensis]|uniref:WD40 repeat domain-containing protein n=1 Tax=Kitasatospora paranensis TaxID=258053 RepID=UPI0031E66F9F